MKIFLPFQNDANTYLDEIIKFSTCEFIFDNYKNYNENYKIVNIHWPESIFDWLEFRDDDLKDFEVAIKYWKKNAKIIYTVHNLERHIDVTDNFIKLYQIVEENSDVFIHLGKFSKKIFEEKYPDRDHKVINHPLYSNSFKIYDKGYAREILGIRSDALVIIAPGRIRTIQEKKMVVDTFDSIKGNNKVLLATNMYKSIIEIEFPGRHRLKKILDVKNVLEEYFLRNFKQPQYYFNYGFLENDKFSLMMSAADIVLIPRIKILNSGNVFLGLTFHKMIVGPNQGNVNEVLKLFNFPIFNPKSVKTVRKAIKEAINQIDENRFEFNIDLLEQFYPENVALSYDNLIKNIMIGQKKE